MGEFLLVILIIRLAVWLVNLMRKLVQSLTGLLMDLQEFSKTVKQLFKKQPDINKLDTDINTWYKLLYPGVIFTEGDSDKKFLEYLYHKMYHPLYLNLEHMAMLNTNNKTTTSSK